LSLTAEDQTMDLAASVECTANYNT